MQVFSSCLNFLNPILNSKLIVTNAIILMINKIQPPIPLL